jgi:teichuronic acid biosynthesis glycosyltransferase TuaC
MKCPMIMFAFIGPGEIPEHPDNCLFTGAKPPDAVRTWLNAADCFILPTYTDAVPAVVMEAFACGIPAITTDIGGCPEIVEGGVNGLMVPVKNVNALQEAVEWMHFHLAERIEMGRRARITAIQHYNHNVLTEKLITVHQNVIDSFGLP